MTWRAAQAARQAAGKLYLDLPDPLPLAGVDIPRATPAQYVSKIEPMLLFQQAERELLSPTDDVLRASVEAPLRKVESAKKEKRQRALKEVAARSLAHRQFYVANTRYRGAHRIYVAGWCENFRAAVR